MVNKKLVERLRKADEERELQRTQEKADLSTRGVYDTPRPPLPLGCRPPLSDGFGRTDAKSLSSHTLMRGSSSRRQAVMTRISTIQAEDEKWVAYCGPFLTFGDDTEEEAIARLKDQMYECSTPEERALRFGWALRECEAGLLPA